MKNTIFKAHYFIAFFVGIYIMSFKYQNQKVCEMNVPIGYTQRGSIKQVQQLKTQTAECIENGTLIFNAHLEKVNGIDVVIGEIINRTGEDIYHVIDTNSTHDVRYYDQLGESVHTQYRFSLGHPSFIEILIEANGSYTFSDTIYQNKEAIDSLTYQFAPTTLALGNTSHRVLLPIKTKLNR